MYYALNTIIYEISIDTTNMIEGGYWEKDDIEINIKYGWNEEMLYYIIDYETEDTKLICFASYIYLEKIYECDDYKNLENVFLLKK